MEFAMGLDMYLTGERYIHDRGRERGAKKGELYDLGYWRKHPNLHGFIVQEFANGVDECQEIELGQVQLRRIIKAVQNQELPHTTGFFFGVSEGDEEERQFDVMVLTDAIAWLEAEDAEAWRSVKYRASW
jgi:hypothetical protein